MLTFHVCGPGAMFHLVQAADEFRVVTYQDRRDSTKLSVTPAIASASNGGDTVEIRFLGYIGGYCAGIRTAKHILALRSYERSEVLASIVDPSVEIAGEWSDCSVPEDSNCNDSQVLTPHPRAFLKPRGLTAYFFSSSVTGQFRGRYTFDVNSSPTFNRNVKHFFTETRGEVLR